MLQSYLPIYQLALDLQALRGRAELLRGSTYHRPGLSESDAHCPSSNGLGQSELFGDGGSGSFGLEFRQLSTDVAIVAV